VEFHLLEGNLIEKICRIYSMDGIMTNGSQIKTENNFVTVLS
jgi:hypothetical protein